ncbi:F5/8 type C domain-containing protein [Actinacidiphila paucisporea]|uniref:F5/8 type C domain-containing protein n=1 Tax=Actinacidiphila paucisporea TaxID=310782 RepID=A0A1M7AAR3_9ACTN|nr:discoidin domain-containing protein [Actinacidiphila paucisporea]SHL39823.1 F5/8 type C domain-containing protein [Actinacidiphila paucisporea]
MTGNPPQLSRRIPRSLIFAFVAAVLAAFALAVTQSQAKAAGTLLSQGKTATASSTENAGTPASAAVDGNTGTRWSSAAADPQWLQVDLGATDTVSSVTLNWETAYAKAYQIQTSANGTTWTTVYSTTTSAGGNETLSVNGSGRYVRINTTQRATQYGVSLWEFQVYGTAGTGNSACGTTNAALNKTATASSTENAGTPASSAVDGNNGTRWSSAAADPQWLQVDLGSSQNICGVQLAWENAYAKAYQIQVSADGTNWTTAYSTTTGPGATELITLTGTGRYVRMYGTQRATQYGYSLWEIQVFTGGSGTNGGGTNGGTTGGTTTPPGNATLLSYNKPATASTYQDANSCTGCTPAKAFDEDPATRWATSDSNGWVDPGWIAVDLGATAHVTKVVLQWDPAYATAYQIQTSADGTNWTSIYSTTTGKGFKETLTVDGNGRYVRMYGTQRATQYGYSLWTFDVYGTGGNPTPPPALPPNPGNPEHLVWSDEFNGASGTKPDTSKWTQDVGGGQNGELEYYTNGDNTTMDGNGNLVIEARKENVQGHQYTSGRINTSDHFNFTYGHAEARIKVSGTQGLWPAFWMLGSNFKTGTPWPNSGEIDIMEHVGKVADSVYSTLHAPAYNGGNGYGSPYTVAGSDFANDFHTYAVDWDSSHMTFSVDGHAFFTADKATVESTRGPWVYDHPFYIILNNAVGGDWPGAPDATSVFPQRMLVDYVRVSQ